MVLLTVRELSSSIARNQAHRLLGGIRRGGQRVTSWSQDEQRLHGEGLFRDLAPHLGNISGLTGLEIGPGDNLEVCKQCLAAGAKHMFAVERYSNPVPIPGVTMLRQRIEETRLPEPVDFAISTDVMEHVDDVPATMRAAYAALKPGGPFVNSIDLRGHNVFNRPKRPLDFLSCPDALWRLMFSNIATTNRVRLHEHVAAIRTAGFEEISVKTMEAADPGYVQGVLPHLLPRYRSLPPDELGAIQIMLVGRKPLDRI
jgi:hypothetical protein